MLDINKYVEELWNSDAVVCLDTLKEADDAVQTINQDMFAIILKTCENVKVDDDISDVQQLFAACKSVLKNFEKRYKKERGVKHMPGSYRSAKSVIISAIKSDVPLVDEGGEPLGKTALERSIKQERNQQRRKSEDTDYVNYHINRAISELSGLQPRPLPTSMSKGDIDAQCRRLEKQIEAIRRAYVGDSF